VTSSSKYDLAATSGAAKIDGGAAGTGAAVCACTAKEATKVIATSDLRSNFFMWLNIRMVFLLYF
jgi:hypothetical protein